MNFREFVEDPSYSDFEIANLYLHNRDLSIKELAKKTGKSIGELYRIIEKSGHKPNRMITNHDSVRSFADSGMSLSQIADLTGYTSRNVRYILNRS